MLNNYTKDFSKHLSDILNSISSEYKYIVNWYSDIECKKTSVEDSKAPDVGKKELYIVLTPLPSRAYSNGNVQMQIEINCYCNQEDLENAMEILSAYQMNSVGNKWYVEEGENAGALAVESWYNPIVQENFVQFKLSYGAVINMSGSIAFTKDVLDYDIYINNQKLVLLESNKTTVMDSVPNNTTTDSTKKSVNRSKMFTLNFKCLNTNNIFCTMCRSIEEGNESENYIFNVELRYNDGHSKTFNMILNSFDINTSNGTIPTIAAVMQEAATSILNPQA